MTLIVSECYVFLVFVNYFISKPRVIDNESVLSGFVTQTGYINTRRDNTTQVYHMEGVIVILL